MQDINRPIGIFDSGLGGISVLRQLKQLMPNEHFIYYGDSQYAPYGTREKKYIVDRCRYICDYFMERNVKAIVIACNTATSAAAPTLRKTYDIPIIGMEPALKVASDHLENQQIAVLATPLTLKEEKFQDLMQQYGANHHIIKVPCPELVEIVENDELDHQEKVEKQIQHYFKDINIQTLDSIVLGCTHFVFYRPYFEKLFPNIRIIDGNMGTGRHLMHILEEKGMLNQQSKGRIEILNSSNKEHYQTLSLKLLNKGE